MAREKAVACMFCDKVHSGACPPDKPAPKVKPLKPAVVEVAEITEPAPPAPTVPAPRRPIGPVRMVRPAVKAAPATPEPPKVQPKATPPRIVRPPVAQPAPRAARPAFAGVKRVSADPETDRAIELLRSVFGEVEILSVNNAQL